MQGFIFLTSLANDIVSGLQLNVTIMYKFFSYLQMRESCSTYENNVIILIHQKQ